MRVQHRLIPHTQWLLPKPLTCRTNDTGQRGELTRHTRAPATTPLPHTPLCCSILATPAAVTAASGLPKVQDWGPHPVACLGDTGRGAQVVVSRSPLGAPHTPAGSRQVGGQPAGGCPSCRPGLLGPRPPASPEGSRLTPEGRRQAWPSTGGGRLSAVQDEQTKQLRVAKICFESRP